MTREEAIKVIRKMLAYTDLSVRANLTADMVEACRLAIKALEQEDILDKIRAEIMDTGAYEQEVNGKQNFLKVLTTVLVLSISTRQKLSHRKVRRI